jgi:hypothetical protein
VNWPVRELHSEASGKVLMNLSAIACANRGGFISSSIDVSTIAPSIATPPEWLPTSIALPRDGTCSIPNAWTRK